MPSDLSRLDIYSIALVVLHWTVVLTLAIGAAIVWLMKGPAYVADAYALDEAENPPDFRIRTSRNYRTLIPTGPSVISPITRATG